jgi:hypothetical protein
MAESIRENVYEVCMILDSGKYVRQEGVLREFRAACESNRSMSETQSHGRDYRIELQSTRNGCDRIAAIVILPAEIYILAKPIG